jgi:hypothetical protein
MNNPLPPLFFTPDESVDANGEWGANCGPHSIAAACGLSLVDVRKLLPNFRGFMNVTEMTDALTRAGIAFTFANRLKTPSLCAGINRLQWEGPWLNPGVPKRAAYKHTHFVARAGNHVLCTAYSSGGWAPMEWWEAHLKETQQGWHITHYWAFSAPLRLCGSKPSPPSSPSRDT